MPKTITGLEIFATGIVADSRGMVLEVSEVVLDNFIQNFNKSDRRIPLKLGHTTEAFNRYLSDQLNVPDLLLTGETNPQTGDVNGQVRLGTVSKVYRNDNKLLADIVDVPDALVDLIQKKMFTDVSIEIATTSSPVDDYIAGVSLLGGEAPAVPNLEPVNQAAVYRHYKLSDTDFKKEVKLINMFELNHLWSTLTKLFGAPTNPPETKDGGTQTMEAEYNKLLERLGLKPDTTPQALWEALQKEDEEKQKEAANEEASNAGNAGTPDNAEEQKASAEAAQKTNEKSTAPTDNTKPEPTVVQEAEAIAATKEKERELELVTLKEQVTTLVRKNEELEHAGRVAKYTSMAETWTAIPGKPEDLGKEIAEIHRDFSDKHAEKLVESYNRLQQGAASKQYTEAVGTNNRLQPGVNETDEFEIEVRKYAEQEKVTFQKALAHFATTKPIEWRKYYERNKDNR